MLARLLLRPCVLHRRSEGAPDPDGVARLVDETLATTGYVEQGGVSESDPAWPSDDAKIVLAGATPGDLDGYDRVDVDGVAYDITGGPWRVHHPLSNRGHHVEIRAHRAEQVTP